MDTAPTDQHKQEALSEFAQQRTRDEHGHFVHTAIPTSQPVSQQPQSPTNQVANIVRDEVSIHKTTDDNTLLDVHLGNPLRKIQRLLEDIKKQKAFSFDIKGSLGMAGIVVELTMFGIFGGTKAFCSRGEQSQYGQVYVLQLDEQHDPTILDKVMMVWGSLTGAAPVGNQKRIILMHDDRSIVHVAGAVSGLAQFVGQPVIATGDLDVCSSTLTLSSPKAVEVYHQ